MTPADFTVARALADKLMTSCQPSEYWDELNDLSNSQCEALDMIAFECTCCNHWFPVSDRREDDSGQWVCKDCA